jgi:hypothetical protein
VDQRATAVYYVLYRLAQQGFEAAQTTGGHADLMVCTPDGSRVALLRVRTREGDGGFALRPDDRRPTGRNVAYAFVDFSLGNTRPDVFVLRAALVLALVERDTAWPRDAHAFDALDDCRNAWHRLGLKGASLVRSESVVSPSWG